MGECGERVQERERRLSTVVMSEGDWEGGRRKAGGGQTCLHLRFFVLRVICNTLHGMTDSAWYEIGW